MSHTLNIRSCRICLDTKCTRSISMDNENGWLKLLEFCVGLVITVQDEARILCAKCAKQIQNYVKFKKQCHKSDLLWKSFVKFDVKCFTNYILPEIIVKDEDEEYLDRDLDADNRQEIETYSCFEVADEIIDQKKYYDEDLNDNNDIEFNELKENIETYNNTTKHAKNFSTCDVNNSDAMKIKREDIKKNKKESTNIENLEINESLQMNGSSICPKCSKEYASKKWLSRHITTCDGKFTESKKKEPSQEFHCGICDFIGFDTNAVNEHLNVVHFSINDLKCKLCDFSGIDLASMESHRFSHQQNESKCFLTCHKCNKRVGSVLSLEFHFRSVHLGKPGGICLLCNHREFKVFKTWRRHDKSHQITRYICDHCGRKYLYRYLIEAHLKDHSDVKNYVCDECGKRFKRMHGLKLHVSTVHAKTEPVKCTHCNKIFKNPHTLDKHMKRVFAEKTYQCQVCSKCFASEKILKDHAFWHTEERPHCCDACGSSYKAKSQLKLHMRRHTGEKPYQCLQCFKTFHVSGQLKRHISVHTGVRPVKCTSLYCDKTFYSIAARRAHCAKRHKIGVDDCKK